MHRLVPVVPKLLQLKVALRAHADDCCHAGLSKTFEWVRHRFWWPGYYSDIKRVTKECTTCQAVANPKGQSVLEGRIKADFEFDVFAMDLLQLPLTESGLRYVLVVMDVFTRFAWVVPITGKSADSTVTAFNSIMTPVLTPRTLVSDNGSEFKNALFSDLCRALAIKHKFCVPYHPQSDGMVERFNRSLIAMLKAYSNESGKDWPKFIHKVAAAYNSMSHPATGISPFEAMFKCARPASVFSLPKLETVCEPTEFEQLREWMKQYCNATHEWKDHTANETRVLRKVHAVGDLLWCRDYSLCKGEGAKNKLRRKWSGPWVVESAWGNVVYTLKRVGATETRRAHADQVKPFHFSKNTPRELRRRSEPKRPSDAEQLKILARIRRSEMKGMVTDPEECDELDSDSDEDAVDETGYVVEEIRGHFQSAKGLWFLVKWEGYQTPTWEHESLLEAGKRVTEYFKAVCEHQT